MEFLRKPRDSVGSTQINRTLLYYSLKFTCTFHNSWQKKRRENILCANKYWVIDLHSDRPARVWRRREVFIFMYSTFSKDGLGFIQWCALRRDCIWIGGSLQMSVHLYPWMQLSLQRNCVMGNPQGRCFGGWCLQSLHVKVCLIGPSSFRLPGVWEGDSGRVILLDFRENHGILFAEGSWGKTKSSLLFFLILFIFCIFSIYYFLLTLW